MQSFSEYTERNTDIPSFNVSMANMPQIDDVDAFHDFLRERGVEVEFTMAGVSWLTPSQTNYDVDKAWTNDSEKPVVVSDDFTIIDGHHRYYYKALHDLDSIEVVWVNLPVNKVMSLAYEFNEL